MLTRLNYMFLGLILLLPIITTDQPGSVSIPKEKSMTCLLNAYNASSCEGNPINASLLGGNALFDYFQKIESTTVLNSTHKSEKEARKLLPLSYCGVRKKLILLRGKRLKRYVLADAFWPISDLTYTIASYPRNLDKSDVDAEIARAFSLWSNYTDLTFTYKHYEPVHIKIAFVERDHENCEPFNTEAAELAHGFPPLHGLHTQVHFNIAEDWTIDSDEGVNLLQVATHEFGHVLGLLHSEFGLAAMAPCYYGYNPDFKLHQDDILGIQELYGTKTKPHPRFCRDAKIDTIFTILDRIYVFKGQNYYRIKNNKVAAGYPKLIADGWPGLPGDIDAAFTHTNNKTYFFKDDNYWCYIGHSPDGIFPRKIVERFIGIPTHLDAALYVRHKNSIFFFKGSEYWRFDPANSPRVRDSYPKPISNLKGLPDNLDAALQHTNGYKYFFKDENYYRFNDEIRSVDIAVPPYPRPTAYYWFGCKQPQTDTIY